MLEGALEWKIACQRYSISNQVSDNSATVVDADNLIEKLSTGVILCKLAKCIQRKVDSITQQLYSKECQSKLKYWEHAKKESFFCERQR